MSDSMSSQLQISINGHAYSVAPGLSVAAALAQCGFYNYTEIRQRRRARSCMRHGCLPECRVTINGRMHQLACQTMCTEGLAIETGTAT